MGRLKALQNEFEWKRSHRHEGKTTIKNQLFEEVVETPMGVMQQGRAVLDASKESLERTRQTVHVTIGIARETAVKMDQQTKQLESTSSF